MTSNSSSASGKSTMGTTPRKVQSPSQGNASVSHPLVLKTFRSVQARAELAPDPPALRGQQKEQQHQQDLTVLDRCMSPEVVRDPQEYNHVVLCYSPPNHAANDLHQMEERAKALDER